MEKIKTLELTKITDGLFNIMLVDAEGYIVFEEKYLNSNDITKIINSNIPIKLKAANFRFNKELIKKKEI